VVQALLGIAVIGANRGGSRADEGPCPADMVALDARSCIDPFEAGLDEIDANGAFVRAHPPNQIVGDARVRAVSQRGRTPQAYVSQREAARACEAAGKRLCDDDEWLAACHGAPSTTYPYGERHRDGYCNDAGVEALPAVFAGKGVDLYRKDRMNDPRLDDVPGTVAPSGSFGRCRSDKGIFDMVGNVHEWTRDPAGTMRGGFFLDTRSLGEGCDYVAVGHDADYHDYSTGFRCCADAARAP
jgi:formylglycine-generating enzyme required for sulfatase activity